MKLSEFKSATDSVRRSKWLKIAAVTSPLIISSACALDQPTPPARGVPAEVSRARASAIPVAERKPRIRTVVPGRRKLQLEPRGDAATGSAARTIFRQRLRDAVASGKDNGWATHLRDGQGRKTPVTAAQLLQLMDRLDEPTTTPLFKPASFVQDVGTLTINEMSQAPASGSGFDYYTTSIVGASQPAHKWMRYSWHQATRRVFVGDYDAEIYSATSKDSVGISDQATYDVHTTVWGGVTVDQACLYTSSIGADHRLDGARWTTFPVAIQYISVTAASAGTDRLQRACNPPPTNHPPCDDMSTCDLDGDGEVDEPEPTVAVGGTSEWQPDFSPPPVGGGGKVVCMATDWYDQNNNYIDTTIDYCWIE